MILTALLMGPLALHVARAECPEPIGSLDRWPLLTTVTTRKRGREGRLALTVARGPAGCIAGTERFDQASNSALQAVQAFIDYAWERQEAPFADVPELRVNILIVDEEDVAADDREASAAPRSGALAVNLTCTSNGCSKGVVVHELVHVLGITHLSSLDGIGGPETHLPKQSRSLRVQRGMAEAFADFFAVLVSQDAPPPAGLDWWFPEAPSMPPPEENECWKLFRNQLDPRRGCPRAPRDWYAAVDGPGSVEQAMVRGDVHASPGKYADAAYTLYRPVLGRLLAQLWESMGPEQRLEFERFCLHLLLGDPALLGRACSSSEASCGPNRGTLRGGGDETWSPRSFCRVAAARLDLSGSLVDRTCARLGIGTGSSPPAPSGSLTAWPETVTWSEAVPAEVRVWRAAREEPGERLTVSVLPSGAGFQVHPSVSELDRNGEAVLTLFPTEGVRLQEDAVLHISGEDGSQLYLPLHVRPPLCVSDRITTSLSFVHFETRGVDVLPDAFVEDALKRRLSDGCVPVSISVEGHADWRGSRQYNGKLSKRRAEEAVDLWLAEVGIGPLAEKKFYWWGEDYAVQGTRDLQALSFDRRAEVTIGWVRAAAAPPSPASD